MESRNRVLFKNTIILAVGQFLPKLLAIVVLPILTESLSQRDYGLYELSLSIASFCIPLLSVQIQQAAFRFLIEPDENPQNVITNSFMFICGVFVFGSVPIIFGWYLYNCDLALSVLFFLCYFSEVLLTWAGQVTRGMADNISYSIAYILYSIVFFGYILVTYNIKKTISITDVTISIITSYTISFLFLVIRNKLNRLFSIRLFTKKYLNKLLSYSGPMVISSIALWIVNLSDRFFISGLLGIEMTAVYGVANRIPNLFNSIYNVFNLAWTENTSRLTTKEKKGDYYSVFFKDFFQVMVGAMSLLISCSPLLFRILIRNYSESYALMSWLFIGVFFSSLVAFFGSIYVGEKRTRDVGVSSLVGAIINVVINALFMKRFGVIIGAISTIVSFLIICIYRSIDIRKYVNINYSISSICIGLGVIFGLAVMNHSYNLIMTTLSFIITIIYNLYFNKRIAIQMYSNIVSKIRKR